MDSIIYPFVQAKISEGYEVVKTHTGKIDKLEVCPNTKCGRSYYYTFKKDNEILKQCPHCNHKQTITNTATFMNSTENFKRVISAHLEALAAKDQLFAETFKKPKKNIDGCINYILTTVKEMGVVACSEEEVFQMAVHYYDEDDLKPAQTIKCHIVSPYQVELTDEEKRQAKQEAIDKLIREEAEKMKAKPAAKKADPKQIVEQPSLFD